MTHLNSLTSSLSNTIFSLITVKVVAHQSREIEQLKARVRDMEIREKARLGVAQKTLAVEYNLSTGRISQITKLN